MIVPEPPVKLMGHCSVIHNNTLYAYSADGFVSLPLERDASWAPLPMGEPVSNAACVTGGMDGRKTEQALYVIGGTSDKGEPPGLQRYSFQDRTWKTISVVDGNMANRTAHKAVYLPSYGSILVYGGQQDDPSISSSATFVISTDKSYNIRAFEASKASPSKNPVLLPWTDKKAALIGGDLDATKVYLFDPGSELGDLDQGWQSSRAKLSDKLSDQVECAMIRGSDSSKVLQTFDMGVAPNTVTSIALLTRGGKVAPPGKLVGQPSSARKRKRGIPLAEMNDYDDTLASSTTRKDYSLAQGDNGLVVMSSGGGTNSLAIFNQTDNSWVNSTKLFYGNKSEQEILATTTSSSPTATSTGASETTGAGAGADSDSGSNTGTIIGATLGSILGLGAILLVILFLIKRKKDRMQRNAEEMDKDRLSFQDQGVEPLTRSAYPMAKSPAPLAASSVDSLAIFSGNMGDEKSPRSAGGLPAYANKNGPKPSPLSTIQSSRDAASTPGAFDKALEARDSLPAGRPGDRRTDEGWGKYFQDNDATNLVGMQPEPASKAEARTSVWPTTNLTPLNFAFLEEPKPLGRVISGSPTTEHAGSPKDGRHIAIPESQSARISSADSVSVASDDDYDRHEGNSREPRSWIGRPPSSTYSRSYYNPSNRDLSSTATPSMHDPRPDPVRASTNTRGSSVLIPDTLEPMPTRTPGNINSDMSWLNLNADR